MIKKYNQFITEADEVQETPKGIKNLDATKYTEIQEEIKKMVDNTIENTGGELSSFIDSYIKNPEDVKVEGFINDSDIYDFYLKFRNDIDEILNNLMFYDKSPSEVNAYGLYEYVIKGTETAFIEIIKMIK
jgi:hypothetical protein